MALVGPLSGPAGHSVALVQFSPSPGGIALALSPSDWNKVLIT